MKGENIQHFHLTFSTSRCSSEDSIQFRRPQPEPKGLEATEVSLADLVVGGERLTGIGEDDFTSLNNIAAV